MVVKEIMKKAVWSCAPTSDLASAATAMRDHGCGFLPVVDTHGVVTGVLTDRDVCVAEAGQRAPGRIAVREVMSHPVFGCFPDDNLKTVLVTMGKHRVRRLPVLDKGHGHLQGILSLDDIVLAPRRRGSPTSEDIVDALRAICSERAVEPAMA